MFEPGSMPTRPGMPNTMAVTPYIFRKCQLYFFDNASGMIQGDPPISANRVNIRVYSGRPGFHPLLCLKEDPCATTSGFDCFQWHIFGGYVICTLIAWGQQPWRFSLVCIQAFVRGSCVGFYAPGPPIGSIKLTMGRVDRGKGGSGACPRFAPEPAGGGLL